MKALYKFIHITAPLTLALLLSVNANAVTTSTFAGGFGPVWQQEPSLQQEPQKVKGGDDNKPEAKAETTKPAKRKKVKARRVNHGPRKPIFPGTDRKKDKLSRARFLNAHR